MPADAFIKIEGIDGESADEKHKGWIEILSYSLGASQVSTGVASTAGGHPGGRVDVHNLTFTKHLDKASPGLFLACCEGKHFPKATIELCRAGGDKLKYVEYKLEKVAVSSISTNGFGGAGEVPTENISLDFGKVVITYTQQRLADGTGGGNTSGGWNRETNAKA